MVWWDERQEIVLRSPVAYAVSQPAKYGSTASGAAARHATTAAAEPKQARATVDLDCEYVRQLVIDSFARRPEWRLTVIDGQDDVIHPDAQRSDFHWAEYERIDWERVHSGWALWIALALNSHMMLHVFVTTSQLRHTIMCLIVYHTPTVVNALQGNRRRAATACAKGSYARPTSRTT